MAMACLRLRTFLPLFPLFSVPRFRRRIADSTDLDAFFPYRAITDSSSGRGRRLPAGLRAAAAGLGAGLHLSIVAEPGAVISADLAWVMG